MKLRPHDSGAALPTLIQSLVAGSVQCSNFITAVAHQFEKMQEAQYNSNPSKEGFVVIGAGLPRTGTNSLRIALSHLLNGPVHHMYYVIEHGQEQVSFWNDALDGKVDENALKNAFDNDGMRASVDYPTSYFYK